MRYLRSLGVLSILALPALIGCNQAAPANPGATAYTPRQTRAEVQVVAAERRPLSAVEEFTGDLLPRRRTRIVAEVEGVVKQIPQTGAQFDITIDGRRYSEKLGVSYGQKVAAGDVLVQLDTSDFEVALRMAKAKLAKASADLAELKSWDRPEEVRRLSALRDEAAARLSQAHRDLLRMRSLVASRAITEAEHDEAAMKVATAQAVVDSAEASLAASTAGPTAEAVAVQEALVSQAAAEVEEKQRQLEKATLRAPYDGVVTAVDVEVGERVAPSSDPLVEVMDLKYLIAEFGVPESYVGAFALRNEAQVVAAGAAQPVTGVVVAINELVDPSTRTFRVRVAIDNEIARLKAGQFVTVRLPLKTPGEASPVVPSRSLAFVEGEPHVFVVEGDVAHRRRVETGLTCDGWVEVRSGVQAGERVVVDDPALISDGMAVTVVPSAAEVAAGDSTLQR